MSSWLSKQPDQVKRWYKLKRGYVYFYGIGEFHEDSESAKIFARELRSKYGGCVRVATMPETRYIPKRFIVVAEFCVIKKFYMERDKNGTMAKS